MNATETFPPFPSWTWNVPDFFNIGVACTDAHVGTEIANRIAMIVEDDMLGTMSLTYGELAIRTSQFAQLLRKQGANPGVRRSGWLLRLSLLFLRISRRGWRVRLSWSR